MPSSLIIVALAAAWLIVLVPMVARNRQEVARPADSALSARVVRSGNRRRERPEEGAMPENTSSEQDLPADTAEAVDETGAWADDYDDAEGYDDTDYDDTYYDGTDNDYAEDVVDNEVARPESQPRGGSGGERPYRPGRGGFDPEAAELAARAKYAYRQRVVVGLLAAVVVTAILAVVLSPVLWWANVLVDIGLVGYLAYLRRQVRIENEIRERRSARIGRGAGASVRGASELDRRPSAAREDSDDEFTGEQADERVRTFAREPRRDPRPAPEPIRHNGVYVDLNDEDPAFYELDEPGEQPFRRAVGQ